MTTSLVLLTRDLRVHDHPALSAGARDERCVVLFVFDDTMLASRYGAPNRRAYLLDALGDMRARLRERGADLVVRYGNTIEVVTRLATQMNADTLHVSEDHSRYARQRIAQLRSISGLTVQEHRGITIRRIGDLLTTTGTPYLVFTPYWNRFAATPLPEPLPAVRQLCHPNTCAVDDVGELPEHTVFAAGSAPERQRGGETQARIAADAFFKASPEPSLRDVPSVTGTSRLSAHLHFGTISAVELATRVSRRNAAQDAFLRQLCWREFHHQLLVIAPHIARVDLRSHNDEWHDDDEGFVAWSNGMTGYPLVDAGMRQLLREGYMHNRVRMVVASFLTKHLRIDWRRGAWHFMDHLSDGDIAVNFGQWQWAAGTGTDSRPNRMFNPVRQSERFDPDGVYIRRYVSELTGLQAPAIHQPWAQGMFTPEDYPAPIVEHDFARQRFLLARTAKDEV
ncbi:MAG: deoxyribodipyrimidine photo-lyase [Nitriliruptoraceae bacterium]